MQIAKQKCPVCGYQADKVIKENKSLSPVGAKVHGKIIEDRGVCQWCKDKMKTDIVIVIKDNGDETILTMKHNDVRNLPYHPTLQRAMRDRHISITRREALILGLI